MKRQRKEEYNDELEECIIVDLDNTLAHANTGNSDTVHDDGKPGSPLVDDAVSSIMGMAYGHGYRIIILTERPSADMGFVEAWLKDNTLDYDDIRFREWGDNRPGHQVKESMYNNYIRGKYNVKYAICGKPSVSATFRRNGLKTLEVLHDYNP